MNQHLEIILNFIQQSKGLSDDAKSDLIKDVQKADGEIVDKTHELEIEAALERVRAVAMSMNTPDDLLNICKALFKELQHLQFGEVRNAIIHTYLEEKNYFIDYDYSDFNNEHISQIPYSGNPIIEKFVQDIRRSRDAFTEIIITGNDLKQWQSFRDANNEIADERLSKTSALYYYMYSIGDASIGISTFNPVPADKQQVLKRFRNVFDLAYKRYVDITNAEAQTREAKIEASLERIRAVAMSMNKPDDLLNICETMYREFNSFGFAEMRNAMINIHDDENKTFVNYDYSDTIGRSINHLQYDIHPVIEKQIMQMRSATDAFSETVFEGKDLAEWKKFREDIGEKDDPRINKATALYYYFYSIGTGSIGISSFTPVKEKKLEVLKRFRNVFDLSYKRYTDLALAEAQAREAQIELSLERTRTQSMIMQHSKELDDTLRVFHEQVLWLGINSAFSFLWLPDEKNDRHIFWAAWAENLSAKPLVKNDSTVFKSKSINYPLDRNEPATAQCLIDWKGDEPIVSYHVPPPGVANYFAAWQEVIDDVEQLKPKYFSGGLYYVEAFMKYGCFGVMGAADLIEDGKKILSRFAIEFERTYTRFLDLQKAEAQAREAQIELALERVRARAMAMQTSEELNALIGTVFTELTKFELVLTRSVILIYEPDTFTCRWWMANSESPSQPMNFLVKYDEQPFFINYRKGWQEKNLKWVYELEGTDKIKTDDFLFTETELSLLPDFVIAGMRAPGKVWLSASFNNFGCLTLASLEPLPEEHFDILLRFAKVFDLTYTRFNDLQKAEAQAREAQIQLALERVRARTMAMQRSDELQDAASLMVQQIQSLGVPQFGSGFNIWDDNRKAATAWMCNVTTDNLPPPFKTSSAEDIFLDIHDAAQRGESLFVREQAGKELETHYKYMNSIPVFREYVDSASAAGLSIPDFQIMHCAFFSQGYLMFITYEHVPEAHDIFKRFAKVFEQTYTRFLDLQKAEAQARESQIEAALERLRAKAMAMHHSDELDEVLAVLCEQFDILGIIPMSAHMTVLDIEHNKFTFRETGKFGNRSFGEQTVALDAMDTWKNMVESWKNAEPYSINRLHFPKETLPQVWAVFYESFASMPEGSRIIPDDYPDGIYHTAGKHPYGYIGMNQIRKATEEEEQIVIKFANEFGRAYTRFLDLQKAEAQARESQIETALERVRSRTMAMQKSEELKEVIQVVYDQFVHLNIKIEHTGFVIDYKARDDYNIWIADPLGVPSQVTVPYFDSVYYNRFNEAKEKGEDFFATNLSFEEKNRFYEKLFEYVPGLPEESKKFYFSCPGLAASTVLLENVCLYIENFSGIAYSDDENKTLMRFGKVFQQTYTRFLDLQKAEAYAKKAQIEEHKLREEKKRSDALLLNILPEEIANELKQFGKSYARKHEEVTILFSDIKGFSSISEDLSADELVTQLDECFRAFDKIVEKHGLEKIKTVGDAYICACGLPTPVFDNAIKTVRAAIDMLDF